MPSLSTTSRDLCRKHFFTLLEDSRRADNNGFQHLYDLLALMQKLVACKRGVSLCGEGGEEWAENKEALTAVQTQLIQSAKGLAKRKAGASSGETAIRRGMECLLLHVALHQYEHPSQFTQAGSELILCSKDIVNSDAKARQKAQAVLVDIVLMLLNETAIADTHMRSAINESWRLLCYGGDAVINSKALQEVLRVLLMDAKSLYSNEDQDSEGEPISDAEESESADDSDEQDEKDPAQESKEKVNDNDDDDDDEDEDDDDDEDEDEEEEEEEDDDENENEDESDADLEARAIAAMMRIRQEQKRAKLEFKQRAIHFKLRVVDLLEEFILVNNKIQQDETRPKPSLPSLLSMLVPVLKATQALKTQILEGKGHKEAQPFLQRLTSLFNKKLCKAVVKSTRGGKAQYGDKDAAEVVKTMREIVDSVLAVSSKAKYTGFDMAGTAVAFLLRVLTALGCEREGPVLEGVREQMTRAAKCCFFTKNPKLRTEFLELQANRSPFFACATLLTPLGKICSASDGEWCPKTPYHRVQCVGLIESVLKSSRQLFKRDQAVATKLVASSFDLLCGGVAHIMEICCQDVQGTDSEKKKKESEAQYLLKSIRFKVILKLGNALVQLWQKKLQSVVPSTCFTDMLTGVGRLIALRGPGTDQKGVACRSEIVHRSLQQFGSTLSKVIADPAAGAETPRKRESGKAVDGAATSRNSSSKKKVKSTRKPDKPKGKKKKQKKKQQKKKKKKKKK